MLISLVFNAKEMFIKKCKLKRKLKLNINKEKKKKKKETINYIRVIENFFSIKLPRISQ